MKLQLQKRTAKKRSELNKLRREGKIPAVIYAKGKAGESIILDGSELQAAMRKVLPGRLSTTVFKIGEDKGKERQFVIKDIQYNITTYDIIHVDLEELHANEQITVRVPIECTGTVDCVGVKLGGNLRQVIRTVRVRCLPKDIPNVFEVDVRNLGLEQPLKLSDISIPKNVRPLMNVNSVAIVVTRK